ncbi:thiamine diphosphokinase [Adlercreutzia sp. ZJ141]|uniref:thiamine diphosphokinase n=1 Tax=Adlercreutzia sp. ZJ141 TaxID=2709406 RepID=UPI0013EA4CA8|nr:thiamine diphosphokinase [Adlercreutzia sp. ZJ141]
MASCALVGASDFNEAHFRACIAANGFDAVFAVDGGLAHLTRAGFDADVAVGDFDSLNYVPEGLPVERHPMLKDASDMELAFESALAAGFDDISVYGGLGRRLDHTLANLQVFARAAERGARVRAIGDDVAVQLLAGPGEISLAGEPVGGVVSVFSMSDAARGVVEQGLKWELDGITLSNRTSLGLSNEFLGRPASVSVEVGTIVIITPLSALRM